MKNKSKYIRRWPGGPQDVKLQEGLIVQLFMGTRITLFCGEEAIWREHTIEDWMGNGRGWGWMRTPQGDSREVELSDMFLYRKMPKESVEDLYLQMQEKHWEDKLNAK